MIKPTIGRRVWYWPSSRDIADGLATNDGVQPCDAGVVYVWNDSCVNLLITDHHGRTHVRTSVTLIQDDASIPNGTGAATWMPYQKAQAEKAGG